MAQEIIMRANRHCVERLDGARNNYESESTLRRKRWAEVMTTKNPSVPC